MTQCCQVVARSKIERHTRKSEQTLRKLWLPRVLWRASQLLDSAVGSIAAITRFTTPGKSGVQRITITRSLS